MTEDLAVRLYALQRVLFHLSEDQQARQPDYLAGEYFQARAAARVIVRRHLKLTEGLISLFWKISKEAL